MFASYGLRFCVLALCAECFSAFAQINLTGTVTDAGNKGIANAKVTVLGQARTTLTDANGKYQILLTPVQNRMMKIADASVPDIKNGKVCFTIRSAVPQRVVIRTYTIAGKLIADVFTATLASGRYQIPPALSLRPSQPYVVAVTIGNNTFTCAYENAGANVSAMTIPAGANGGLAKSAAITDSISVVAVGFQKSVKQIASYEGTQDFSMQLLTNKATDPKNAKYGLYQDIPYKTGSSLTAYEKTQCKLDVHVPESSKWTGKPYPVLVHLFGGGLNSGSKAEGWTATGSGGGNGFGYKFLDSSIIMVSPNYRLGGGAGGKCPDYMNDAAAAVAWVQRNIEPYGGDPDNVFVSGFSAGAYLTLMIALDTTYFTNINFSPSLVRGFLPLSAQTYTHTQVAADLGISSSSITKWAPLGNVRKFEKPLHIFTGSAEVGTPANNQLLYSELVKAGSTAVEYTNIPGNIHQDMVDHMGNATDTTRTLFMKFFRTISK